MEETEEIEKNKINIQQSTGKILKELELMFFTLYFQEEKRRIRKICDIPENGYDFNETIFEKIINKHIQQYLLQDSYDDEDKKYILNDRINHLCKNIEVKSILGVPIEELYKKSAGLIKVPDVSKTEYIIKVVLDREIDDIRNKLRVINNEWVDILIKSEILFSEINIQDILYKIKERKPDLLKDLSLIKLTTAQDEYEKYAIEEERFDEEDKLHNIVVNDYVFGDLFDYPVILRIHNGATKRDIEDFLDNNWGKIELLQSETDGYRVSKTKLTNLQRKTYKIISENLDKRDIDLSQILFNNDIKHLTVGNINKIKNELKRKYKD